MNPLFEIPSLKGEEITIITRNGAKYTGEVVYDEEDDTFFIGSYELVADTEKERVFIVKPTKSDKFSGYLQQIINIEKPE